MPPESKPNCPTQNIFQDTDPATPLLIPGKTCWRLEHANRVALIVDAAAYYTAVKAAMLKAKRSIILLGWDFDTRVELEKEPTDPTVPNRFGPFLERLGRGLPRS